MTSSSPLTPTSHLTALAPPGELADWRLVLAWEALWAAGIIDALPASTAQLAERLDTDPDAAHALLSLVAEWNLVRFDDERWQRVPGALAPEEAAELVRHANLIRRWASGVPVRLRGRRATIPAVGAPSGKPRGGINLASLAHASVRNISPVVEVCLDLAPDATSVLDLGGGHGHYAEEFARRGLSATLQDLPAVVDGLRGEPHCDGIELYGEDALTAVAPGPFDLIACCMVTNMFDPEANMRLIANAVDSLAVGGHLVVVSLMRDRNAVGACFGVQMLVATPGGDAYESFQYDQWLREAGLSDIRVVDIPGTSLTAVAGKRV